MTTLTAAIASITTATVTVALETDALMHLRAELSGLAALHGECSSVREARALQLGGYTPMWPALPSSEQSTSRGTNREYLYLYWSRDRTSGAYSGPDGSRKTYIGCKRSNITLAREMVTARRRFLSLRAGVDAVACAIRDVDRSAAHTANLAARARINAETLALDGPND